MKAVNIVSSQISLQFLKGVCTVSNKALLQCFLNIKTKNNINNNISKNSLSNYFQKMGKLKIWASEEDEILIRVNGTIKSKKWKKASEELKKYNFERSDVECRQRYINHLDPTVKKEIWTEDELLTLYNNYGQFGNKWFLLQKFLPGRTQTKIKNYFYGNIRYFLKIITKYFLKKSTGFINDIRTEILLDMYDAKNQFQKFTIFPETIKMMNYRVEKHQCEKLIKHHQQQFYQLTQHFLKCYTEKSLNHRNQIKEEQSLDRSSSDQIKRETSQDHEENEDKKICNFLKNTSFEKPVYVVCSTNGRINDQNKEDELLYLKKEAEKHLKLYENYQRKYQELLAKPTTL